MAAARETDDVQHMQRALAAWRENDVERSIHAADRDAIRSTEAARALVLELLGRPLPSRDLYNACARLGRLLADVGASPSLAVSTVHGAVRALAHVGTTVDASRVPAACGSVAEGYFAVVVESERALARRAWEYPSCAVRVTKETVAIACGNPTDDADALADWAARVALAASRDGAKEALLSGDEVARAEVAQALSLVGIKVVDSLEAARPRGWFSSLLKK
ncbi:MAG: hypothetical protein JST00_36710 [Deltaproteobacteria bacterium]|nr:hypothetical protein [Deltaproteobacteria bacterium]